LGWGGESQFQFNAGFRGRARGDAHFSNNVAVTGNAVFSEVSAQAMHSAPPAGAVAPMDTEGGQIPVRRDFSDLAHWSGLTRTNADGKATVTFKLPDSLTNWRVVVKAVSPDTRVGQATTRFKTFRPVMVWPMIPRIFTVGDEVELFAKVHNQSSQPQTLTVHFEADQGQILSKPTVEIDLEAGQSAPVYWTYRPGKEGQVQLLMSVKGP
ncbi:MAG: hypothetical protein GY778_00470, partial [bacterium]|nr:hypothetical protein [bacterium]